MLPLCQYTTLVIIIKFKSSLLPNQLKHLSLHPAYCCTYTHIPTSTNNIIMIIVTPSKIFTLLTIMLLVFLLLIPCTLFQQLPPPPFCPHTYIHIYSIIICCHCLYIIPSKICTIMLVVFLLLFPRTLISTIVPPSAHIHTYKHYIYIYLYRLVTASRDLWYLVNPRARAVVSRA